MRSRSSFLRRTSHGLVGLAVTIACTALFATWCAEAAGTAGTTGRESPIRIFHMSSRVDYSPAEWSVLTQKSSAVVGLDGHGYEFPGALPQFSREAPDTPAFAFSDALAFSADWCDDRFPAIDVDETSFFHSSEPASIVARVTGTSKVGLYWHADSREDPVTHVGFCTYRDYYRTVAYVMESSATPGGPYSVLAEVPAHTLTTEQSPIYWWSCSPCSTSRYYRVSSRLSDGTIVPYSWSARPQNTTSSVLYLVLRPAEPGVVEFEALVRATPLPPPEQFILEKQARYEKTEFVPIASATQFTQLSRNFAKYSGTVAIDRNSYVRVRFGTVTYPESSDSILYSGGTSRRNNRSLTTYGSMALRPTSILLREVLAGRARAIVDAGGDGLFLDFVHDNIGRLYNGGRSGTLLAPVSSSEELEFGPGYRAAAEAMLDSLHAQVPEVSTLFNGLYVPTTIASAREAYVPRTDGMFVEYFAFDNRGRNLYDRIPQAFDAIIAHSHRAPTDPSDTSRGKISLLASRGSADEVDKRRVGLALYLLVSHQNVMWQYSTAEYYRDVTWLPEFSLPLGPALIPALNDYSDLFYWPGTSAILRRAFENGLVLYNHTSASQSIDLGEPLFPVLIQPGLDPILGGTGRYEVGIPVSRIDITSLDAVILLRTP